MKTEVMSISEFLHREPEPFGSKFQKHLNKYGKVYQIAGITVILLTGFELSAFAAGSIDIEAGKLYKELLGVGKWIIVFKGGFDTLKMIGNGDFDAAKKSFFGYLLTYLFLLGLPYGLDKVDQVFASVSK